MSEYDQGWDDCLATLQVDREEVFAARATIDRLRESAGADARRAGAAEKEIDRLCTQLHNERLLHAGTMEDLLKAEAAIARVGELVRHYDPSDPGAAYYSRGDILRALDGGTE